DVEPAAGLVEHRRRRLAGPEGQPVARDEMDHLADEERAIGEYRRRRLGRRMGKRRPGEGQQDGEEHHFFRTGFDRWAGFGDSTGLGSAPGGGTGGSAEIYSRCVASSATGSLEY